MQSAFDQKPFITWIGCSVHDVNLAAKKGMEYDHHTNDDNDSVDDDTGNLPVDLIELDKGCKKCAQYCKKSRLLIYLLKKN